MTGDGIPGSAKQSSETSNSKVGGGEALHRGRCLQVDTFVCRTRRFHIRSSRGAKNKRQNQPTSGRQSHANSTTMEPPSLAENNITSNYCADASINNGVHGGDEGKLTGVGGGGGDGAGANNGQSQDVKSGERSGAPISQGGEALQATSRSVCVVLSQVLGAVCPLSNASVHPN